MNYDQILRELTKLDIKFKESRHGASKGIELTFNRQNTKIEASFTHSYKGGYTGGIEFYSTIYETKEGVKFTSHLNPRNQTEFFNIIQELKTTKKSLRQISNKKDIKDTKKTIKKLEAQFKDTKYRLAERKLWLKYIEDKITNKEHSKLTKELARKSFPERYK